MNRTFLVLAAAAVLALSALISGPPGPQMPPLPDDLEVLNPL